MIGKQLYPTGVVSEKKKNYLKADCSFSLARLQSKHPNFSICNSFSQKGTERVTRNCGIDTNGEYGHKQRLFLKDFFYIFVFLYSSIFIHDSFMIYEV